jgi:lipoate-protein ligase B
MLYIDLGKKDYVNALSIMIKTVSERAKGNIGDVIFFCEHSPIYTVGKSGKDYPDTIDGIKVYRVNRGGDITFHGPGQVVGYPIIKLDDRKLRLTDHIKIMEEAIINVLSEFGLNARWIKGHAGVWVDNKKVASIGVAVDRWVTYHGFALNVNIDLSYFEKINPCGLDPIVITSISKETGKNIEVDDVKKRLRNSLEELYGEPLLITKDSSILSL